MTQNQIKISEIAQIINGAKTITAEGRQAVANGCKELYNTIEEDAHSAGADWMLNGMYRDLCTGNFAEPFLCEKKKETFNTIVAVYNERIAPRL